MKPISTIAPGDRLNERREVNANAPLISPIISGPRSLHRLRRGPHQTGPKTCSQALKRSVGCTREGSHDHLVADQLWSEFSDNRTDLASQAIPNHSVPDCSTDDHAELDRTFRHTGRPTHNETAAFGRAPRVPHLVKRARAT
jgi:hypothetical protein